MGSDMYRERILDHYRNPRNYGELDDPSFVHDEANTSCGDAMRVAVELDEDGEVTDIGFTGDGCAISIASASLVTEALHGESIDVIHEWDQETVIDLLEIDVSPMRMKCAMLAEQVIEAGYEEYTTDDAS